MTDTLEDLKRQLADATARSKAIEAAPPTGDDFRDNALALDAFEEVERLKERIAAREASDA